MLSKNVYWSSCEVQYRYSCQILIKLKFSRPLFNKILKYHVFWKSVQWKPRCSIRTNRRADRQTDRQTWQS